MKMDHSLFSSVSSVCDRFVYVLNFAENKNLPYKNSSTVTYFKLKKVFDILNLGFSEVNHPAEYFSVGKIIVLFKGKVVFR